MINVIVGILAGLAGFAISINMGYAIDAWQLWAIVAGFFLSYMVGRVVEYLEG